MKCQEWAGDKETAVFNGMPLATIPVTDIILPLQVFQCLLIEGENVGPEARRNATTFVTTDEQFERFIQQHQSVPQLVPHSNTMMRDSYLILDEYVRFNLNSTA